MPAKKKEAADNAIASAFDSYVKWRDAGKKRDATGIPALPKAAAMSIAHFLLPKIDPEKDLKEYKTMRKCNEWLGGVAGGTTWDAEMESFLQQRHGGTDDVQPPAVVVPHGDN